LFCVICGQIFVSRWTRWFMLSFFSAMICVICGQIVFSPLNSLSCAELLFCENPFNLRADCFFVSRWTRWVARSFYSVKIRLICGRIVFCFPLNSLSCAELFFCENPFNLRADCFLFPAELAELRGAFVLWNFIKDCLIF